MLSDLLPKGSIVAIYARVSSDMQADLNTPIESLLQRRGVKVISYKEPMPEGPLGALLEGIIEAVDEFYSRNLGQDTLRGCKEIARQGYWPAGRPPVGYKRERVQIGTKSDGKPLERTRLVPDPETAPRVLKAFQMAAKGYPFHQIARVTQICADKSSLSTIFNNQSYLGKIIYNRQRSVGKKSVRRDNPDHELIVTENAHEVIITPELFAAVRDRLKGRRPKKGSRPIPRTQSLLSGLIFCARDGQRYNAQKIRNYRYYQCSMRAKKGKAACPTPMLRMESFDKLVLQALASHVFTVENVTKLLKDTREAALAQAKKAKSEVPRLSRQLRRLNKTIDSLYKALETGAPTQETVARIQERVERKSEIEAQLQEAKAPQEELTKWDALDEETINQAVEELRQFLLGRPTPELRGFLEKLVEKIVVDGSNATIHYTFQAPESLGCSWLLGQDSNLQPAG